MGILRATQFYQGTITSTSYVDVYTVPAGHRIIFKSFNARNRRTSSQGAYCREASGTELVRLTVPASSNTAWSGWIVLNEGEKLQLAVDASPGVDIVLSGTIHYI